MKDKKKTKAKPAASPRKLKSFRLREDVLVKVEKLAHKTKLAEIEIIEAAVLNFY